MNLKLQSYSKIKDTYYTRISANGLSFQETQQSIVKMETSSLVLNVLKVSSVDKPRNFAWEFVNGTIP